MLTTLPPGTIVRNRYLIESVLGRGHAGGVYLVKDLESKQKRFAFFVLKEFIHPNRQVRHQVMSHAMALTKLEHPALPRVVRAFGDENYERVYMVLRYIEGVNLETLRQQEPKGYFSLEKATALMTPILEAVEYLHHQEPPVIHQNIAPATLICAEGDRRSVLVGLAFPGEFSRETAPVFQNVSAYDAPELYSDELDAGTDVYSLGATYYTLLTGALPADAFYRSAILESEQSDPLTPLRELVPAIPQKVADVIQRALCLERHQRYASVELFVKELQKSLAAEPAAAASMPLSTKSRVEHAPYVRPKLSTLPPKRTGGLSRLVVLLSVLILLIGGSIAAYLLTRQPAATHTHADTISQISPTPTSSNSANPTPSFTATSNGYPQITGSYAGTIVDQAGKIKTNMFLTDIQQSQNVLRGYFSGLQISGTFRGSVDRAGNLQLTVVDATGRALLFLEGGLQSANSLSGDYYQCDKKQGGQCQRLPGGGIWNALSSQ